MLQETHKHTLDITQEHCCILNLRVVLILIPVWEVPQIQPEMLDQVLVDTQAYDMESAPLHSKQQPTQEAVLL